MLQTSGTTLNYTVGEKSISKNTGVSIPFDLPQYKSLDQKKVDIGLLLLKKYPNNQVKISDKGIKIDMVASNLLVAESKNIEQNKLDDTKMTITLGKSLGALGDDIRISVPAGYKVIIAPFTFNVDMQVQRDITAIVDLNGSFSLLLEYDKIKQSQYKYGIYIAYYDKTTKSIQIISSTSAANGTAKAQVSKAGQYLLVGKLAP